WTRAALKSLLRRTKSQRNTSKLASGRVDIRTAGHQRLRRRKKQSTGLAQSTLQFFCCILIRRVGEISEGQCSCPPPPRVRPQTAPAKV
uniref:Ovule protein n=1 Tax=Mesocestoides corti TaxID=53468 RepID=A0A5K3FZE2_MESCO